MEKQAAVHRRGDADGDGEVSHLHTCERSVVEKENSKRHATHRRVKLACFIVALAAVDQKVDIVGVCSDGVREVRLR